MGWSHPTLLKYTEELESKGWITRELKSPGNNYFPRYYYSVHFSPVRNTDDAGGSACSHRCKESSIRKNLGQEQEPFPQEENTQQTDIPSDEPASVCVSSDDSGNAPLAMEEIQTHIDSHVIELAVVTQEEASDQEITAIPKDITEPAVDIEEIVLILSNSGPIAQMEEIPATTTEEIIKTETSPRSNIESTPETIFLVKAPASQAILDDELCKAVSFYVTRAERSGRLENPGAYRATLTRKALSGELDLSAYRKTTQPLEQSSKQPDPIHKTIDAWKNQAETDPPKIDELRRLRERLLR
jgi:hypothetical protein